MKPALAFTPPKVPKCWQHLPMGEEILTEINQQLEPWWPKFFGYHLLKVGALSEEINSDASPIKHQVNVSLHTKNGVIADIDDLPFLEHSVDVCLVSHALEFSIDPHHIIRESNRVLIPNGYMVITGFNPVSLAGLNRFIPFRRHQFPWKERFFSAHRVKDWLNLMGYEILADQRCLYTPLLTAQSTGFFARKWQHFAKNYLAGLGSVYVIVAKKRRLPLTPVKPKWQFGPKFRPVSATSMQSPKRHTKEKSPLSEAPK